MEHALCAGYSVPLLGILFWNGAPSSFSHGSSLPTRESQLREVRFSGDFVALLLLSIFPLCIVSHSFEVWLLFPSPPGMHLPLEDATKITGFAFSVFCALFIYHDPLS